jgi:hypothetical protein
MTDKKNKETPETKPNEVSPESQPFVIIRPGQGGKMEIESNAPSFVWKGLIMEAYQALAS